MPRPSEGSPGQKTGTRSLSLQPVSVDKKCRQHEEGDRSSSGPLWDTAPGPPAKEAEQSRAEGASPLSELQMINHLGILRVSEPGEN